MGGRGEQMGAHRGVTEHCAGGNRRKAQKAEKTQSVDGDEGVRGLRSMEVR
jgi:hypothetical protein